jgi:fatty-acid desaturase
MTTSTITRPTRYPIAWPTLIWIGAIHLGALLAFVPAFFSWSALAVCVLMHWFTGGIGICLCYHRLLTHRSFQPRPKFLEYILTAIGCSASEGGPIGWVADHRRHHAHSDEPLDVHTPHEGFLWAHMMWFVTPEPDTFHTEEYYQRWAPDLAKDKGLRWFDTYHFLFPILNAAVLFAIGGVPWLVWGFFVSTVFVLHSTWLVNSATHVWGYRTHTTRDDSTNNWWVALLTYGEGWHNNHHAHQTSARHGHRWWEFDMTYMAIRTLGMLGLARAIKLPKPVNSDEPSPTFATPTPMGKAKAKAKRVKRKRIDEEPELVGASVD